MPIIAYFGINILVSVFFAVYMYRSGSLSPSSYGDMQAVEEMVYSHSFELSMITLLLVIAVLLPGFLKDERKKYDAAYESSLGIRGLLTAALFGIGSYMAVDIIIVILDGVFGLGEILSSHDEAIDLIYSGSLMKDILLLCIVTPFAEELMMRGKVFNRLRQMIAEKDAVMLSAVIFACLHMGSLLQMAYTFLLGYLMSYAYMKYENILMPVVIHAVFNLTNFISEIPGLTELMNTRQGMLIYYFTGVILISFTVRTLRNREKPPLKEA